MTTTTTRDRDIAYQLHPFTNLGRHETEGPLVIKNLRDFVTVRGGGYFFMPGKRALQYLAHASGTPAAGRV